MDKYIEQIYNKFFKSAVEDPDRRLNIQEFDHIDHRYIKQIKEKKAHIASLRHQIEVAERELEDINIRRRIFWHKHAKV